MNPWGAQSRGKLHVHCTDNTDWPPAGDTFAEANLSQTQTVTKFFSASILWTTLFFRAAAISEVIILVLRNNKGGCLTPLKSFVPLNNISATAMMQFNVDRSR